MLKVYSNKISPYTILVISRVIIVGIVVTGIVLAGIVLAGVGIAGVGLVLTGVDIAGVGLITSRVPRAGSISSDKGIGDSSGSGMRVDGIGSSNTRINIVLAEGISGVVV